MIIIINILLFMGFFIVVLANSFLLEPEWHQVSLGFEDSSENSGQSQQRSSLDGLNFITIIIIWYDFLQWWISYCI